MKAHDLCTKICDETPQKWQKSEHANDVLTKYRIPICLHVYRPQYFRLNQVPPPPFKQIILFGGYRIFKYLYLKLVNLGLKIIVSVWSGLVQAEYDRMDPGSGP